MRQPLQDGEVLLDEHDGRQLGDALEDVSDLADDARSEALRRLVDEQQGVAVEERAGDRDHLLLPARERSGALAATLAEDGEQVVDELVVGVSGTRDARRRFSLTVNPANTSRSSGT